MSPCPPGTAVRASSKWTRLWLSDCLKEFEKFLEVAQGLLWGREREQSQSNCCQNDSHWIIIFFFYTRGVSVSDWQNEQTEKKILKNHLP